MICLCNIDISALYNSYKKKPATYRVQSHTKEKEKPPNKTRSCKLYKKKHHAAAAAVSHLRS